MHEKDEKWIHNIRTQEFHKTLNPTSCNELRMHEKDGKWIDNMRTQEFHKTLNPTRRGKMR
jgi:hypothetical protein